MNLFNRTVLLSLLLSFILSACGIKGLPYLPEHPEQRYPHRGQRF